MQIKRLHTNIYKLYAYARTQECLDAYRKKYTHDVQRWEILANEGTDPKTIQSILGFSRATYYRMRKNLHNLNHGIMPPSKRPKHINKPKWGETQLQLILNIRRQNPTYGKEKITHILKRDHQQTLSESTVGRILSHLKQKGLIHTSPSALRTN